MYGLEICVALERFSFLTWDINPVELVHLHFCKSIIGIGRSTSNPFCRVELGRRPLKFISGQIVMNVKRHCDKFSEKALVKLAMTVPQ